MLKVPGLDNGLNSFMIIAPSKLPPFLRYEEFLVLMSVIEKLVE